ncbi:MAG: alpha/beta hydrolase [Geminicoccaceae bacterium]|nr:alpha/beta hydrolase [Geminicoccaceae bacterium]
MIHLLLGGVVAYGVAVTGMYLLQDTLLFPRAAVRFPASALPPRAERVVLQSVDGDPLVGTLLPALGTSRGLLVGFGGNAWNADDLALFLGERAPDFDLVVFHYRGYQPSGGRPSEHALYADAVTVHDWAVGRLAPPRVYAVGFSLGSAVAAYLASQRQLDGLVLVTPFDSIEAIALERYPWVPVRALLRHPFRADAHLRGRDLPVAVIAASKDRIVPKERTEALVAMLARPVLVASVPDATHNGIYDHELFDRLFRQAFARLDDADRAARERGEPSRTRAAEAVGG